jgi:hypothetical protein
MKFPFMSAKSTLRKPETATLAASLLLALGESIVNRYRLDVEKQVASIGYFFSERRYDVRAIVASREIATYFLNKTLGMSEQYGLKVNLLIIGQMLNNTLKDKTIHGDRIFERLLLMDNSDNPLVDTSPNQDVMNPAFFFQKSRTAQSKDPEVFVNQFDGDTYILISAPCFHREQLVGTLMVWINVTTILTYLVDFLSDTLPNAYHLTTVLGQPICPPGSPDCLRTDALTPERVQQLPMTGFESIRDFHPAAPKQSILMTRQPIPNMPLQLLAWMPESEIYGALSPWQILMGMENGQKPMSEQNRKNIGRIVEQAVCMVHIINHVRMFAREAGKTDTSRVDLNDVVRSGVGLLAAQLKSHGLHLEQEMTPCPLPVQVNPYSIVEEFDGYIQFESTEDVSSAFKINFPAFLPEESSDGHDQSLKHPDCG